MTKHEIKLRQLTNQHLTAPSDKITVIKDLCGVQSQFMVNAIHSLRIRTSDFDEKTVGAGLVKNWTLRGTVHVFAEDDLPLFLHCENGEKYRKNEWGGYTFWNQRDCWSLTPERQKYLSDVILLAVGTAPRTRDELKELCRGAGMTESEEGSMFDQWGGGIRELCERGFMNYTVEETKRYAASSEFTPIPEDEAKLLLAERYFTNIAPATIHDAKYFFHTTEKEVKEWLSKLPVISVECEGKTYFYIENGKKYDGAIPKCIFLAGFDQLMLGYEKKESLYLSSENLRRIFNLSGIVMPSILLNGEIVGKWKFDKNRKKPKLTMELFREISKCETSMLEEEAFALFGDSIIIEQK